ncbi:cobalamin-binding protein [Pseudoalteromonas fenneropenaei]|uniref:Cobalamin-binding protein n=1 Tax=Pseudoalteromonas fenneropenaei TaxID=1737459 RepID=A0ABV7CL85_9GAMM
MKYWLSLVLSLCAFGSVAKPSAQRIIALAPHIVENLYVIGAGERIVGTVEYADFPEAANAIPRIGGYHGISMEKLLALKPDLVIAWQTGNKQTDLDKIAALGIPVVYSHTHEIADVAKELREFGQLTGLEVEAEKQAQQFETRFKTLQDKYQSEMRLAVFYQLWPEPMMTIGRNTWVHQLLEICQVDNVFADASSDYPQIGIENVIHAKPQVIILPDEKTKQKVPLINWQAWPEIPAAKHQQYIHVNADLLHRYTTRVLDGIDDMCAKLALSKQHYQQGK